MTKLFKQSAITVAIVSALASGSVLSAESYYGTADNSTESKDVSVSFDGSTTYSDIVGTGKANNGTVVAGNISITVDAGESTLVDNGDLIGGPMVSGSSGGTASGTVQNVSINIKSGKIDGTVQGGAYARNYGTNTGTVEGKTTINVEGGTITEAVIGGGKARVMADNAGYMLNTAKSQDVEINISSGSVNGIVGGGVVNALDETSSKPIIKKAVSEVNDVTINVTGGTIGSLMSADNASVSLQNTTASIIGGGVMSLRGAKEIIQDPLKRHLKTGNVSITIANGIVNGDIIGGAVIEGKNNKTKSENEATVGTVDLKISSKVNGDIIMNGVTIDADESVEPVTGQSTLTLLDGADVQKVVAGGLKVTGDSSTAFYDASNALKRIVFDSKNVKVTGLDIIDANNNVEVVATENFNDDHENVEASVAAMSLLLEDSGVQTFKVEAGESNGQAIAQLKDGQYVIQSRVLNAKTAQFGQNAHALYMTWALNKSEFNKRMGELRDATGTAGVWARVDAGEQKFKQTDMDFKTLQFGVDRRVEALGNAYVGVAFSYSDADLDYQGGSGTNKIYSLGAYGSWISEKGSYLDVIGKVGRLESDAVIGGTSGDYDMTAYSLSTEIGHRFTLPKNAFVEPQFELSYGYADGASFNTIGSNQKVTKSKLDSTDSLTGRVGVRAGWTCPQNRGSVYAHASVVHEFLGDVKYRRASEVYKEDFSDTWVQYGVGAQYNMTNATYLYGDVQRTSGGDISESWRVNLGLRYSF